MGRIGKSFTGRYNNRDKDKTLEALGEVGLAIVLLVRIVGIVMVIAILLSAIFILSGLSISYQLDLPSGLAIIAIAAAVYLTVSIGLKCLFGDKA